ncbi:hypothetical protein T01_5356 [Trichinella spiralis]|uniref:SCAN domain-containing protein 3 n=1 Tax=Trichinella spiralis TaxID=6334 RepID=A0A0V1AMY2_TRISP|nr:hypothetical protein T01_5356 [Trichinella spiralis]
MKRWCRQNSHDLNTAYTCDRYQQVQILINALLQHQKKITKHFPLKMQKVLETVEGLKCWKE